MATEITSIPNVTNVYVRNGEGGAYVGVWEFINLHVRIYDLQSGQYYRVRVTCAESIILQYYNGILQRWITEDTGTSTSTNRDKGSLFRVLLQSSGQELYEFYSSSEEEYDVAVNKGGKIIVE